LLSRARLIGEQTACWAEAMIQARGIESLRVLQGLLSLTHRHKAEAIERACEVAFFYEAIKQGFVVLYRSIFDVVRNFLHDEAFGGEERVLSKYLKPDLLIVDEMGMKQLPKRSGEYLFEIIMRRYETRSTMMTSNRPLEDWGKLIGDIPSATAILDRFLHHAEIITITRRSYRLRTQGRQDSQAPENDQPSKEGS
jgi:hypothetical protein